MPRPKLKSDDEVLEAATVVLKRCGPIEFTLSGVAKEVGLSRAALIQRFTNRDTLLVRMMERGVEQVRHYLNAIPIGAGPQGLWEFLQVLVRSMNTRNDFSVNYLALLQRLAAVRGRLSLCADQAAAAKWWLSMPMASVSAEGPMPKALSTRRTSPLMPGCRHQGRACPLRRARMTSNPLIVA